MRFDGGAEDEASAQGTHMGCVPGLVAGDASFAAIGSSVLCSTRLEPPVSTVSKAAASTLQDPRWSGEPTDTIRSMSGSFEGRGTKRTSSH